MIFLGFFLLAWQSSQGLAITSKYIGGILAAEEGGETLGGIPDQPKRPDIPNPADIKKYHIDYEVYGSVPNKHFENIVEDPQYFFYRYKFNGSYFSNIGNDSVDKHLKQRTERRYLESLEKSAEIIRYIDGLSTSENHYWQVDCFYFRPSDRYLSILVHESSSGSHSNWQFEALNFDLATGKSMSSLDIFPDTEKSTRLFWEYVETQWQGVNDYFLVCNDSTIDRMVQNKDIKIGNLAGRPLSVLRRFCLRQSIG